MPIQTEGILSIIHGDDFGAGKSSHTLVIHDDGGRDTAVRFKGPPPALGDRISVYGVVGADGGIDSAETVSTSEPMPDRTFNAGGSQNAIFILVKFLNSGTLPFTQADVQAVAVSNTSSVANYFQEVSYGKQLLNITVTPWVTAQINTSTTCDYTTIANAANTAATKAGYNLG